MWVFITASNNSATPRLRPIRRRTYVELTEALLDRQGRFRHEFENARDSAACALSWSSRSARLHRGAGDGVAWR